MIKKSSENLSQLKENVLNAVLNNQPFPGSGKKLSFPDLPFVLSQPVVYLVDKDVKNTINVEKLNKPLQVVTAEFLKQNPEKEGRTIYFQFHSTKQGKDDLLLSLDAKVYSSADDRTANLSSLQLKFQKDGDEWIITDDPASLSA